MQIRIEITDSSEDEVIIRCSELSPEILKLQKLLSEQSKSSGSIVLLTSSSLIEFQGTHKQIYVSRGYYKALKDRLDEKRR